MKTYLFLAGLLSLAMVGHTFGSTPSTLDPPTTGPPSSINGVAGFATGLTEEYPLNKDITVVDWVLCNSQASAEEIIAARESKEGSVAANAAYQALVHIKACGILSPLQVKLEKQIAEASDGTFEASLYLAAVQIKKDSPDTDWPDAFVFDGSMLVQ